MTIDVLPLDPADDGAVEQAYRIRVASWVATVPDFPEPSRRAFVTTPRRPMPGTEIRRFLARLDGVPVGLANLELPLLDNTDNAELEIEVLPEYRRRGVGRALHEHAVGVARGLGRKRIMAESVSALPGGVQRDPAGERFARAMGAEDALTEVRRRLDVPAVDWPALDRTLTDAWARAADYSLVSWAGATPPEHLADIAYLTGRLMAEAPTGDLAWEAEKIDADRQAESERIGLADRGRRLYGNAVRHDPTGRLVGLTRIDFADVPAWHALQQITLVDPAHRGHRLGMIMKIENLRYVVTREPELRVIDTWNAAVNQHMISINEVIGYRPVDAWTMWQLTL